jgi:hypothetical protein
VSTAALEEKHNAGFDAFKVVSIGTKKTIQHKI